MNTNTEAFGTTVHSTDFDYTRTGIVAHDGIYTAFGRTFSRDFKTLKGAIAYMARFGYNADGTRV